ncbi:MAG: type II secretion system protein GspE [Candidatus Omnitrophica bacterium CG11_big_fil_rev_8_21_14_0_20_63_9]|nr:MAG: type II secretion system protein GspE [Candidatus Omnitrophica bacterium CG11_big_fil_rev_8_21_14_0_20_63_9]
MPLLKTTEKIGEILIKAGLVSEDQLSKALEVQRGTTKRIGEILVELKLTTERDIAVALSEQLGIQFASTASGVLNPKKGEGLEQLISEEFARQHLVLPLSRTLNVLTIACVNPLDLIAMDNLSRMTHCEINPIVTTRADLEQAIERFFGGDTMLREAIGQSYKLEETSTPAEGEETLDLDRLKQAAEEAPVIRLVDLIIRQAIKERASDIHIEPFKDKISLRYRIDGVLVEISPPARSLHAAIISRIKILCKLDIAQKRLPQDGGFMMTMEGRGIDFRVSSIPSIYGEKIVIRILDKPTELMDLGRLGFEAKALEAFRQAIRDPYGLILITGPTGSGKSTTLYAALNEINSPKKNIITIEDPVEYRLEGVNQVQIKPSIGLTFATGLRAFMRQDPDVIMVGETRDLETAEICVRASLTGHLVFSTLHTNDAPSAVNRLIDIGLAPYLLSSTISLVVAQRLLRKLCDRCKEAYEPLPAVRQQFRITEELLFRAKGCEHCTNTGYRGRIGVYEVMTLSRELRNAIASGAPAHVLKDTSMAGGMRTLWDDGLTKVMQGSTSLEELESVILLDR